MSKDLGNTSIVINAQYIKDLSFENPRAAVALTQQEQPSMNIGLEIEVYDFDQNMHEVVLKISAEASNKEKKLLLIELEYAGLCTIDQNLPQEQKEILLWVYCPGLLFPYARCIVSNLMQDGGYPPVLISPVDFAAIYMQRKERAESDSAQIIN